MKNKDTKIFDVAIIGGGASGMMAAISCKTAMSGRNPDGSVVVLEKNQILGKKLLATGNGTCNISNTGTDMQNVEKFYYSNTPGFSSSVISGYGLSDTLNFFKSIGIMTTNTPDQKIYPFCRQAQSVVLAFEKEISRRNIQVINGTEITEMKKKEYFCLKGIKTIRDKNRTSKEVCEYLAKKVIIAAGGKAYPALSSNGSGYPLAIMAGHSIAPLSPAITQINTFPDINKNISGQRWDVSLTLVRKDTKTGGNIIIRSEKGEILFTDYGISGPVSLQLSRHVAKGDYCNVDFMPDFSERDIAFILKERTEILSDTEKEYILTGILPLQIAKSIAKKALGRNTLGTIGDLKADELGVIIKHIKRYPLKIKGKKGWETAQVTAGGVSCNEIDKKTCMSLICRDLFFCGEILDVDGDCGGFNLQFAWSSGYIAGTSAGGT